MSSRQPIKRIPQVFCSHCLVDKPRVFEVARKLGEAGICAWFDEWEIKPGENIVVAINRGLACYDVGLIFFSNELDHGKWAQAEISALTLRAIEDGKSVIPVILDSDVPIPPSLRPHCRVGYDQVDQLIGAILGRAAQPASDLPHPTMRQRRFIIHVCSAGQDEMAVRAELDGAAVADERLVHLGVDFRFSYDDFLRARSVGVRRSAKVRRVDRDRELLHLGDAVGRVLFDEEIGTSFADLLDHTSATNEAIDLIVATEIPRLLAIPFEAARLFDGRIPVLERGVRMTRRLSVVRPQAHGPRPGPLKILVAVGAPDEGKTPNAVLDMERELQSVLDSIEKARLLGNAYVRILEVGSLEQIRASLKEQAYHVLHLSGHGRAGVIELEDEDGNPVQVTAAELASAIRDSEQPAPLVFLASCSSGVGASETASLALGLLQQGMPAIMAMQTSVTDNYATRLAASFYTNLSTGDRPLASDALAVARQELECERRRNLERGKHLPSEYATPSLFCSGEETPIFARSTESVPPIEHIRKLSSGAVPMLSIGDLVGRRMEMRQVMQVLTDHERSITRIGRRVGCQIVGIGGVGKSAITGRAMARLADRGWTCVAITGKLTISELAASLSAGLLLDGKSQFADTARALGEHSPEEVHLRLIAGLLSQSEILLVLDNFEENLIVGGDRFLHPATAKVMQLLYRSAQRGKILITSRHPVPDADEWLALEELGPLSPAQTSKLMLRLTALRLQEPEGLRLIQHAIGGHPRMLEYLDAILRQGKARVPDVARRLSEQAERHGISLVDAGATLEGAIRNAMQVGAGDILLDELLELVAEHEGDLEVLYQASVFSRPVSVHGLAFCTSGGRKPERSTVFKMKRAAKRIAQTSLLTRIFGERVWVHRWTAEVLRSRISPETFREYCRRAGEYLTSRKRSIVEVLEAIQLFLAARRFDQAAEEGRDFLAFLRRRGQVSDMSAIARELAVSLPREHQAQSFFLGTEADAYWQLGLSNEALTRFHSIIETLEERVRVQPDNVDLQRDLSVSYNIMGDALQDLGQGGRAHGYFQKSLDILDRLIRQEPNSALYLRDLSASHIKMGGLLASIGQGEQARIYFQKSLDATQRVADQNPDSLGILRDLSVVHSRMADLLRDLGHAEQARIYCQMELDISKRLVGQEPDSALHLSDLSGSYDRMGSLLQDLGQGAQARAYFQRSLEINERLASREPDRVDLLRDLSFSYNRMGELSRDLGQGEWARAYFQKSLDIFERLTALEPDRVDFLSDLCVCRRQMGDLLRNLGQGEAARTFFQKSLDVAERLAAQEPNRVDALRSLSASYAKMGDLLQDLGEGEAALASMQKSLKITERLVDLAPNRVDDLHNLSVWHIKMGDVLLDLGQGEQARTYFQKSLDLITRLTSQEPDRVDFLKLLSVCHGKLGSLLWNLGQGEKALAYFQKSLGIDERLASQEPNRADLLSALSASSLKMGDLLQDLSQGEKARAYFQKSLDIAERLAGQEPAPVPTLRHLSVCYGRMAHLLLSLGEGEQVRAYFQKSLDIAERLAGQEPDRGDLLHDLYISYSHMGDLLDDLNQGEEALTYFQKSLAIAERVAGQEPDRTGLLRDLSVSYLKVGDSLKALAQGEQAVIYFEKSLNIAERLACQEPDRADFQRHLSVSYGMMGGLLRALGQIEKARLYQQKDLDIAKRLARQEPDRADLLRDLFVSYGKMGDLLRDLGMRRAARVHFKKSSSVAELLVLRAPDRADFAFDLAVSLLRLRDRESQRWAVDIVQQLDREQKLTPQQRGRIAALVAALDKETDELDEP